MTLPYERVRAVINTQGFLYELVDPKKTPRIPKSIRKRAAELLKHYPSEYHVKDVINFGVSNERTN